MALLNGEARVSGSLRKILADLPIGAPIPDSNSERYRDFYGALEYFLPDVLEEIHIEWHEESFDGFYPLFFARKTAEFAAEIFGMAILISDMARVPFYLHLQLAIDVDEVSWLECRVGRKGYHGMMREKYDPLWKCLYLLEGRYMEIDWAYQVTFGERRN